MIEVEKNLANLLFHIFTMTKNNSEYESLQIRYKKNSTIGQIIEHFKDNESNKSDIVREYIFHKSGFSYLKSTNASSQKIYEYLISSIQFYNSGLELAKLCLEMERRKDSQQPVLIDECPKSSIQDLTQDITFEKSSLL